MTIYHKHHIIPKHAGGTDDPSNIVLLTIEEHAEAHKQLFETHGRKQDEIAWRMLAGLMKKEEMLKELYALGGKISGPKTKGKKIKGHFKSEQAKYNMRKSWENREISEKHHAKNQFGENHWTKKSNIKIDTSKNINKLITCNICGKTTNAGNIARWHQH